MQRIITQSPLSKVPIARILVPYITGIIACAVSQDIAIPAAIFTAGIAILIGLGLVPHTPSWSMKVRSMWIIPVALVSMAIGWGNCILCAPPEMDIRELDGAIAQARIDDINYSNFSMSMCVTLTSVSRNNSVQLIKAQHDILLTTRGCDYSMSPGDMICFECKLDTIKGLGNPDGFDYQAHMLTQGMRYREHLPVKDIIVWGNDHTLMTRCNKYRHSLQRKIFASSLSTEAQNFVIATLLGNSRFILPETRSHFSAAGISHVLALSGLHVGIIMAIIWFMLFPLDYIGKRRFRFLITIVLMGLYATFTGLSPSVVRSTVMMIIVVMGLMFYRKSVSLNALATAAMVILAFNPIALYSVGFQLSFTTVAAFLLFLKAPEKADNTKRKNRLMQYINGLIASTVIAMLSTIMLTAWYFSSVSLSSVLGNILIMPIFPVVMITGGIMVMLCAAGVSVPLLNGIVNTEYDYIHWVATLVGDEMPGHIDYIYVTEVDVAIYYMALIFVLAWYRSHRFVWLNWAAAMVVVVLAHGIYTKATTPRRGLVIFNNYSQTQIFSFNGNAGNLWTPYGGTDIEQFTQYNKKFIAHYGIDTINVTGSVERDVVNGKRIVCVTGGKWKNVAPLTRKIETDILVVTKKYHSSISRLLSIYEPGIIILSGDIYDGNIDEMIKECKVTGVPYFNIKEEGAWIEMDK